MGTVKRLVGLLEGEEERFLKLWDTCIGPANREWWDHRHSDFELALITGGRAVYHTQAGLLPMEPGDVFVFPGNEPHMILQIFSQGVTLLDLHFDFAWFQWGCTLSRSYPNLFFAHSKGFATRIPAEEARVLGEYILAIRRELEGEAWGREEAVGSYLNLIFGELMRCHSYYRPEEGVHTALGRIRQSLQYMDRHWAEDITLEQVAAQSGMSPNYFSKLFHDCFHCRLWDYILSKRVEGAKRLLSGEGSQTVLEIATSCGFHNTANFNRIFRRFTGMTPTEYRRGDRR